MFFYRVRLKPVTEFRGPRFIVESTNGLRMTVPYDHAARNPSIAAAEVAAKKWGRPFTVLEYYSIKSGEVFVLTEQPTTLT